jgi:hypothetical protein
MGLIPSPSREGLGWGWGWGKEHWQKRGKEHWQKRDEEQWQAKLACPLFVPHPPRLVDVVNGLLAVRP